MKKSLLISAVAVAALSAMALTGCSGSAATSKRA
ncbi:MAG: hypothetical protein RLZZ600_889, partial [Actinomycetota bacterium]